VRSELVLPNSRPHPPAWECVCPRDEPPSTDLLSSKDTFADTFVGEDARSPANRATSEIPYLTTIYGLRRTSAKGLRSALQTAALTTWLPWDARAFPLSLARHSFGTRRPGIRERQSRLPAGAANSSQDTPRPRALACPTGKDGCSKLPTR
jgi:hypothetical protein